MTTTAPAQQIDLTPPSDSLTYVEILTPGGVVRVSTNLVSTRTGQPAVVVEIERQMPERPNSRYRDAHAVPSGTWDVKVDHRLTGACTEITLTRQQEVPSSPEIRSRLAALRPQRRALYTCGIPSAIAQSMPSLTL